MCPPTGDSLKSRDVVATSSAESNLRRDVSPYGVGVSRAIVGGTS
jgi:hypothetical protein